MPWLDLAFTRLRYMAADSFADSFVYLGSTVTNNGDLKPEIERRRALSSNVMQALRKPLWSQQSISRTTKMRIYNAAVLSVLLYGAETWPLTGTLSSRLDGFDSRALRSILGIHWRDLVSNETVRTLAGQPPASWLPAAGSAGMDMCFACHRTILLGLSWTSTPVRSAGSDPKGLHEPVGLTWSNAILTSSASTQPQLNPSRRTVINGGLLWIWLAQRTTRRRASCTRHDDDDEYAITITFHMQHFWLRYE